MTHEPEVIDAKLKELGCPYADERAIVWLQGYQKGFDEATNNAITAFNRLTGTQK